MTLDLAVAAVRLAVRRELRTLSDGRGGTWTPHARHDGCVMVACSGGADSLALLSAAVFELRRAPVRVIGVVVDHGLQDHSAAHTTRVVGQMAALGVDETASIRVTVDSGTRGVEAGAREARYAALQQLAEHFGAEEVLIGHTLDDQAETVLLGLARGSGGRSLTGMRRGFYLDELHSVDVSERPPVHFSRPLLGITRAQTEASCRAEGIEWWDDPHNADPRFARSRVRHTVLPILERELGPGISPALSRTGEMLREDMDALDLLARKALEDWTSEGGGLLSHWVESALPAIKHRALRLAVLEAGALRSDLTRDHVLEVAELAYGTAGDNPQQVQLPGHLTAYRDGDHLRFRPTT